METENGILDDGGERQHVEQIRVVFPHIRVPVLSEALVVKAVDLGDLSRLVVTTQDGDAILETDLEADQQGDRLHRIVASVDVVPHEQIVGVGRSASDFKQLHEIVELAVDVAANRHGTFHGLYVAFLGQDFPGLFERLRR